MTLQEVIRDKLEQLREYEWEDCTVMINRDFVQHGENVLDAIARNIAEAIENNEHLQAGRLACQNEYKKTGNTSET